MATLKEIKKRINSVKNTKKVTKAMQMIAAARLRKAQEATIGARAYTKHLNELVARVTERFSEDVHPYLQSQTGELRSIEFIVVTSDRGLCGGFNENLLRELNIQWNKYLKHGVDVTCTVIGRKGFTGVVARGREVHKKITDFYNPLEITSVRELVDDCAERYMEGKVDRFELVYNHFRSAMVQEITFEPLLPMVVNESGSVRSAEVDYLYEPSKEKLVAGLVENALTARLYQACLESMAGELGARMLAMDNATKNANEMIDALTMKYNRIRQADITKELLDIVNGAESLKG